MKQVIIAIVACILLNHVGCDAQASVGFVYINSGPLNSSIILAEPKVLSSNNMINITVCSTLIPQFKNLDFTWTIEPADTQRFIATEGS